jgi:XTP/dITP diphosphohydrolase
MNKVYFATTNQDKVQIAQIACAGVGIKVVPVKLDIDEIQGEIPELIIKDKVRRAYEKLGMAVVVSDDTWDVPALQGFPGPYMKSINHWFTPQDFLRLMSGIKDRKIILHQYLAYTDSKVTKVFKNDISGKIINEVRGTNRRSPNMTVIVLDSDNGKTIAEVLERGNEAVVERYRNRPDAWHGFAKWYAKIQ